MKLKRIMAIVLCFAMVLSTMSFSVFAEDALSVTPDDFQSVLMDAPEGSIIQLTASETAYGFYHWDVDFKDITIIGADGATVNKFQVNGTVENLVFQNVAFTAGISFSDTQVDGLTFDGCTFTTEKVAITAGNSASNPNATRNDVTITGCSFTGSVDYHSLDLGKMTGETKIVGNTFENVRNAFQMSVDSGSVLIDDNTISNTGDRAMRLATIGEDVTMTISNNVMTNACDSNNEVFKVTSVASGSTIKFEGNSYDGEAWNAETITGPTSAVSVGVVDTPTETIVAEVDGEPFTDIQEAIKAAAPSGTVEIINDIVVDKWIMFAETMSIGNGNLITLNINGLTINGNDNTLTIKSIESARNGNRLFYDAQNLNINDLTIEYIDDATNQGGIGLQSGTLENVNFVGGGNAILPGNGEISITGCDFATNGTAIYYEEERDNLVVTGCEFNQPEDVNVILIRGNTTFTNNVVNSGRTVNVVSGSPVVTGNDFGDVRFKVYNEATATIENNEINVLAFNDESTVNSTFGENTLSAEAQAVLNAATAPAEKIVAKIGDNEYATFADALENAVADDVITVYDTVILEEDGTIDLKGARVNAASTIVNAPVFRVLADVTFTNGIVDGRGPVAGEGGVNCYAFIVGNSETAGSLTINSGTYRGVTSAISITNGTVNILGGTFQTGHDEEGTDYGTTYLLNCNDAAYKAGNAVFNITGGKFVGFNPENNAAEGASTNFLSGNYKASDYYDDDKWYVAEANIVMDDDKYFATIKDAFDTLKSADKSLHTIKLLEDLDVDVNYVWYKYPILVNGFNILLDLNGKNITADWSKYTGGSADMSLFMMANGGVLTITGEGEVRNLNSGDVNTEARIFWLMNEGSTLTIESGTFIQEDDIHMLYTQGGPTYTYIKGGNFQMVGYEDFFNSYDGSKQETVITGGTFNQDPTDWELTIPPEYAPKLNPDGTWSVVDTPAEKIVAKIGDEEFDSIQAAVDAATDGDVIIVTADHEMVDPVLTGANEYAFVNVDGKSITIDLNGKKITANPNNLDKRLIGFFYVHDYSNLVLTDSSEDMAGSVRMTKGDNVRVYSLLTTWDYDSYATIEGGNYYADVVEDSLIFASVPETITVNGGNFTLGNVGTGENGSPWIFNVFGQNKGPIIINGGTFNDDISNQYWAFETQFGEGKAIKDNGDGTWSVATAVASVTDKIWVYPDYDWRERTLYYATLEEAIAAANAASATYEGTDIDGEQVIVTLLDDTNENVTINGNIVLDGADFDYTGKITVSGDVDVTIQKVKFVEGSIEHTSSGHGSLIVKGCSFADGGYAVTTARIDSVTIEDCTVLNQSLLYAKLSTSEITVKNINISGGNYVAHIVYNNTAYFENVTATAMTGYGIQTQNYGAKTITLKNCSFDTPNYKSIAVRDDKTQAVDTFVFQGENSMTSMSTSDHAKYVLDENATLKADEGYTVTASNDAFFVKYVDGTYKAVKAIAQIGDVKYESLAEAFAEGGDIVLLSDVELAKTITVKKDASLDLNGKTISGTCNASQAHMFMVNNGATMTIKDSSAEETGKITFAGTGTAGWIVDVEGALVLDSGTLEMTGDYNIGYAVDVRPNAWGTAYTTPTTFVMNGGKIINTDDGGVRVASTSSETYSNISASFTMNGGEINVARDGVFVQQSNAAWDVLSFTMNNGTITAGLSPVRLYGPAATSYANGEDCLDITLNGGTLNHTDTESSTAAWIVQDIIRANGGATVDEFMKDSSVTASATFAATATAAEGYKWSMLNDTTMTLVPAVGYSFELTADKDKLYEKDEEVTITLNVNSTDAETFYSISGKLGFDDTKLEYTGGASTNGTIKVQGLYIGDEAGYPVGTYKTFTFKVLDDIAANETLTFTMNGIVVGTEDDAFTQTEALEEATETVELVAPYTVTLPEELTGETTVIHGNEYVVSVKVPEELHKNTTYTITYTCGENTDSKVVTADDFTFTVPADDVVGPLSFTFTSENKLEVEVKNNFVTGHTLILVKGDAKGYLFNDNGTDYAMYQVGNYKYGENNDKQARAWVVKGEMTKEQAFDLITIDEENDSVKIAEGHNVNAYAIPDGRINFLDATAAHASYQIRYDIPAMVRAYLASDVNADYQVTGTDVNEILTHADYVE